MIYVRLTYVVVQYVDSSIRYKRSNIFLSGLSTLRISEDLKILKSVFSTHFFLANVHSSRRYTAVQCITNAIDILKKRHNSRLTTPKIRESTLLSK